MTNDLLDLICFYGDQDPQQEETPDQEKSEDGVRMFSTTDCAVLFRRDSWFCAFGLFEVSIFHEASLSAERPLFDNLMKD